ncbi:MAG: DsbA family protein [Bacteroidota bacterium]
MKYLLLTLLIPAYMTAQTVICDPETGLCTLPETTDAPSVETKWDEATELIYVGDPLCSWCWGVSPQLFELEYTAAQQGIGFRLVMGGLRPGGGDPWNEQFTEFLRHHWEEVQARSGQPFTQDLLSTEHFHYDTEPPCRAVVVVREMAPPRTHRFYEHVQHYFYVKNQDPNQVAFYEPICQELGLDFAAFAERFASDAYRQKTRQDFALSQSWGVRGFPSVLLRQGERLTMIARGYSDAETMWKRVQTAVGK